MWRRTEIEGLRCSQGLRGECGAVALSAYVSIIRQDRPKRLHTSDRDHEDRKLLSHVRCGV